MKCLNCANEEFIHNLNGKYSGYEFRLLRVLNSSFTFITIRKLSSRILTGFLTKSEAEELFQSENQVEVTNEVSIEAQPTEKVENSAFKAVAIVFIVAFFLLLISLIVGFLLYKRRLIFHKRENLNNSDRFSGTLARENYINNTQQQGDRSIRFNENAEVVEENEDEDSTSL